MLTEKIEKLDNEKLIFIKELKLIQDEEES